MMKNIKIKLLKIFLIALSSVPVSTNGLLAQENSSQKEISESSKTEKVELSSEEKNSSQVLESVQVTALRFDDSIFDLPVNAQNISSKTIDESGLVSVPDVLRRYADVYIRNAGGSPYTGELSMRGFGENSGQRVLVLIDGQRLNTLDLSTVNWAQVPLEEIENIEVLRGPQTAAYGNYAESGVVKITTRKWNQPDYAKIGGFFGTYGEYSAYARAAHSSQDYYASANLNYYHNSGYLENSLNWSKTAGVNAGAKLDEKNEINFMASGGNNFQRWANPISSYQQMIENPTSNSGVSQENSIDFATISSSWDNHSAQGEGSLQLGMNMRDCDTLFPSTWGDTSNSVLLWTATFTPHYRLFLGENDESYLEGGIDFYYDNMTSKRYADGDYSNKIAATDIERATVAPWLGGKYAIDDTFSLNLNGRYEIALNDINHNASVGAYDENKNLNGLAAQFGFNAKIDKHWNAYFRFDQVYRYPAIDEMASYWGYGGDRFNPNLSPERGQNYEIGVNFLRDGWKLNTSLFFMHLDDEIMCNPVTYENQNIGATDRYGADIRIAYELEMIGASTSWTFVSAKFEGGEYNNSNVPFVPTIVSSTRVWVKPVNFCQIALEYEWTSQQYMGGDFSNSQAQMPAFWTVNITANFFITENIRAFIALNNITDEIYANYAVHSSWSDSWYPALGRNIRAGIEIKF